MTLLFEITIPFTNPVLIFTLALLIILFAPILFRKIKIPGIIGLILAGVAVGPHGLKLLAENSSIDLLGPIGLLYLMFLTGLEIDIRDFSKNKNSSLLFGSLTFIIPIAFGLLISIFILQLDFIAALLLASMFSTNTLISYPIAGRLGIIKNRAVQNAIGGTIITDTAVLLLLAVILELNSGELNFEFWLKLLISLGIFVFAVTWVLPKLSRWFMKYLEGDSNSQYIYVLLVVFISALFSMAANVEPIIGAFLAGLALNKLIPHSSALMNRIIFIGNTLFIPFFLLSVGMLIDLSTFSSGKDIFITGTLVITAIITKFIPAYITQKLFKYSNEERNLLFGLSSSRAAATIAIILIGYKSGLLNDSILNGTIMVILITCLISSFFTEIAGRKVAIAETGKKDEQEKSAERILIPISNPANINKLAEFSVYIQNRNSTEQFYPLIVVPNENLLKEKITEYRQLLESSLKNSNCSYEKFMLASRVDINIADGISRAATEIMASFIVIGWNEKVTTTNYLFGSVLDNLISKTKQTIFVLYAPNPLFLIKNINVIVAPNAHLDIGFNNWIHSISNLAKQTTSELFFFSDTSTLEQIKFSLQKNKSIKANYKEFNNFRNLEFIIRNFKSSDFHFFVNGRPRTISYNKYLAVCPRQMNKQNPDFNFAFVLPEQKPLFENTSVKIDEISSDPIEENIERIHNVGKFVKKMVKRKK